MPLISDLTHRCEFYLGIDAQWPDTKDAKGVPRVIALYDGLVRDESWNWPGPGCVEYVRSLSPATSLHAV